jgi:hypothetical protein
MNDVDMLLRDTLRDRAEVAPTGTGLLTRVHTRSRLIRRRRRVGVAGAGAAAVVLAAAAVPAAVAVIGRDADAPGGGFGGPAASGPAASAPVSERAPSAAPTVSVAPVPARLAAPEYRLPVFPFTPGSAAGLGKAQAWVDGEVFLMHSPATDSPGSPSLQVYTGAAEPTFDQTPAQGVQVESGPMRVRGVMGTLRTESMTGFVVRSLYWRESGAWIWVRANDMEPAAIVAYAEGLRPGSVQVQAPMTFDLLPQGLVLDNVGPSDMVFRLPGQPTGGSWENKLGFVLNADGGDDAASWPLRVNGQPAKIHLQDQERSAWVLLKNGTILVIQVPQALVISDEDLLRLAAGVHVSATAQAGRG